MVLGRVESSWISGFEIWVAIPFSDVTSFAGELPIEKIEQAFREALGSLPTIFAHSDERRPVKRPEDGKYGKLGELHLTSVRDKAIEVRQTVCDAVADGLETIKRNTAHGGETGKNRAL